MISVQDDLLLVLCRSTLARNAFRGQERGRICAMSDLQNEDDCIFTLMVLIYLF